MKNKLSDLTNFAQNIPSHISVIKLAYYQKKDWKRFVKMVDDPEVLHSTWFEWYKGFEKAKKDLENSGFQVIEVVIDLDELEAYCFKQGCKIDGSARSKFVLTK